MGIVSEEHLRAHPRFIALLLVVYTFGYFMSEYRTSDAERGDPSGSIPVLRLFKVGRVVYILQFHGTVISSVRCI